MRWFAGTAVLETATCIQMLPKTARYSVLAAFLAKGPRMQRHTPSPDCSSHGDDAIFTQRAGRNAAAVWAVLKWGFCGWITAVGGVGEFIKNFSRPRNAR